MRLSTTLNYARNRREVVERVTALEDAGLDIIWVPEVYTFDAPSIMGFLAARTSNVTIGSAILSIYSRSPALLAMTAAGIDALSDGRFILGIGASGPQVVEGFHGIPYDRPIGRTREVIEICRKVWARTEPLTHNGTSFQIPVPPEHGTGLGKPLRMINRPLRDKIPIWVAAMGPKNVMLTAEIADGWLPVFFIPERAGVVFDEPLQAGLANRDPGLGPLEIAAGGSAAICDDPDLVESLRGRSRSFVALYVGGMGARNKNFYNTLISRYGWEREAAQIQDLYLDGRKDEAAAAVPDDLLEQVTLIGSESYLKDRIAAYKEAGVTVLDVSPIGPNPISDAGRIKELIS